MASDSTVAVVRCADYENGSVQYALTEGIRLLGGLARFAKPGEHVLLKPNMLAADVPERCVTTHPSVLRSLGQMCLDAGAAVVLGG